MVLTPPIVFAQTDGIDLVLLNHTCTRGPSVTRMPDFFFTFPIKVALTPYIYLSWLALQVVVVCIWSFMRI